MSLKTKSEMNEKEQKEFGEVLVNIKGFIMSQRSKAKEVPTAEMLSRIYNLLDDILKEVDK